jgi:MFS transporter, ACS family, D-galactonate transporter
VSSAQPGREFKGAPPRAGLELRDSRQRWWLMALLATASMFCYAHRGALSIAAPSMMQELGLSPAVMGVLLSAFFWSYAFLQVPAGWFVDRFGVKRAYGGGFAIWSAASTLTAYAVNLPALIAVRMLLGVGQATAFPASARAVANWFHDRERGTVTATYLTGVRLGQALVAVLGGLFLASHGWKAFFLVTGLVPMLWLLPWWLFLGRWERAGEASTAPGSSSPAPRGASLLDSVKLLRHRTVLGIFLGFFAYNYTWYLFVTWLPAYLVVERGFSQSEMGFYSSVPFLAMSIVILGAGFISDWLIRRGLPEIRVRKAFVAAGLGIACLIVPAGMVEDKVTAVWLLTVSLCALGLCSANTWTLTQAVCDRNLVGTVSGIQNFGGNLGGIVAPALTGYIAHTTGSFSLALSVTGAILAGAILCYLFLVSEHVGPVEH